MINKEFNISLDIKQTATIKYPNIILVSGDTNVYHFNISLIDGGNPLDLTSVDHVWIVFKKIDGEVVQADLQITDTLNGKLTYMLGTQEIAVGGAILAEIELYGSNNENLTSTRFEFYVRKELNTDDAVQSSTQYSVLTNLINDVETDEAQRTIAENTRLSQEATRQTGYTNMINDGYIQWKQPVNSFVDLSTVYPSRQVGWASQVINEGGKAYRWNGIIWAYIASLNIIPNKFYNWVEEKTVPIGGSSFVLTNQVASGQQLLVYDLTYNVIWTEGVNWSRSGQTISIPDVPVLQQAMTFKVINLG